MTRLPAPESDSPLDPLALRPPYFPLSTDLVDPRHYAGGIPIRALEGNLQCIIPPWGVMGIGDEVELYWHSLTSAVDSKPIQFDHEVNQQVVLRVPRAQVLEGDAMPVFYRVKRRNQGPEDSEPKETYLVKTTRPGGYDDSPEPGHSGFRYTFLTDISGGVDADMADRGVQLRIEPYENMTAFDRIVCRWGSQEVMHYPVTQEQVDDPANNPIVITFTREVIEKAGDGSRVVVTYQVIDCVGNYPDERDPWAPFRYVLVDLGGNRLDAPLVLVNNRPTNSIDLDQLGDDDVEVRVYTTTADFAVGDSVRLTWTGTPAQGSPIIVGPLQEFVDFVPFQLDFTIPNAAVKAIAQGFATVSYVRVRSGETDRPSKTASVSVQGDISRLPAPSVAQAPGGTLPPDSPYATISVPYFEGRKTGDLITVHCQGRRPGGGETYYPITIIVADSDGKAAIARDLPGSQIAPLQGGTLKIYYVVANDDLAVRSERDSLPLELNIGVAAPDFNRPEITEADGDTLLPENTPNGANVIAPFNLPSDTRAGDTVGLRWTGSVTGAHPLYELPLNNQTAGKPVPFFVRPEHIHPNLNGTVTVDYYRKRAGEVTRFSVARVWSVGSAELELNPPMLVAPATNPIDVLAYATGVTVSVEHLNADSGDEAQLIEVNPLPGTPAFPVIALDANRRANFTLSPAFLAARQSKDIELSWVLIRNGKPNEESEPLELRVNRMAHGDTRLPTPTITAVTDNATLDLTRFTGNTEVLVKAWLGIAIGQRLWVYCEGKNTSGTIVKLPIHQGVTITGIGDQRGEVTRAFLDQLANGSEIKVFVSINFDGLMSEEASVRCPTQIYSVKALVLEIDTSVMLLNGLSVKIPYWPKTGRSSVNNTATRLARNGKLPYVYTSSDDAIASVTQSGEVTGNKNGGATILVKDSMGNQASYRVEVSNIWRLVINENKISNANAMAWMRSINGVGLIGGRITDMNRVYYPPNRTVEYWACSPFPSPPPNHHNVVRAGTFIELPGRIDDVLMGAWCTTPY
ncbi:Ig-like domain-containing protein [Pseudomonas frederiksbergensis]|uniref:Ig-like domain-containing protein n=1 Tax=Pseudomonas frederiksbergensis TaxID=104087 RepID=UPI003D072D8C